MKRLAPVPLPSILLHIDRRTVDDGAYAPSTLGCGLFLWIYYNDRVCDLCDIETERVKEQAKQQYLEGTGRYAGGSSVSKAAKGV